MVACSNTLPSASRMTVVSGAARRGAHRPRTQIGRYAIEGMLGAGGMAVVYLARDPMLGRAVALKVVRVDGDDPGATRLVREGQALARIAHPNVISVYEVGRETDGLIYIAMERIVGVTLAEWLELPREPSEILEVFAAAGRGLSAAHAAGLVHRDFKPENVMVGHDGRVCVLDFGLARASCGAGDDGELHASELHDESARSYAYGPLAVTDAGSVIGTPAYMSPEQWRGERAGVHSDQFGFCVALWRALTGEHPFDTSSREVLRSQVLAGRIRRPPPGLPRRLHRVLRRGLATDPGARFTSMDELVGELAAPPRRRWLVPGLAAGLAAAVASYLLIGAASSASPSAPSAPSACRAPISTSAQR
ncbi:MAG TPA: serine/threonine-protein kinase [Kofleriaceae bacterium]|nr:serine/threonine-protein kinase [Kofleriaceae bacterium]